MRQNPEVCFEIDRWEEDGSWKSVIVWGEFEEISSGKSQRAAMKIYSEQVARVIPYHKAMPAHGFVTGVKKENDPFKSVVFKINIKEKSGRFEER
jgi:nitroimidazol reductase NimA-like FMN-containing flavoprotein (pyridoxamine 5'-phosphate oxidase superfamily)